MEKPLNADLRELSVLLQGHANSGKPLAVSTVGKLAGALRLLARRADLLLERAAEADELEDELPALVQALAVQPGLKAQQFAIQQQLDRGEPDHVSRPGLAALAMPIGDTNVVAFPVAPQPRPFGGGDAA